jgi:hypothetical protein
LKRTVKMVLRIGGYLFAAMNVAALVSCSYWYARAWHENLPEDVAFLERARSLGISVFALLGVLPLAWVVGGLAWQRSLRWWEYLIAVVAAGCGALGVLMIVAVPTR